MLKTILYDPQQTGMDNMFNLEQGEGSLTPWVEVRECFRKIGYDIETPRNFRGSLQNVEWVIFQNMPPMDVKRSWLKRITKKKNLLSKCISQGLEDRLCVALYEPHVVKPENYDENYHKIFSKIFTWDQRLIKRGQNYKEFVFIQPSNPQTEAGLKFEDRKLLCNFSANKKSSHHLELYSERRNFIKFMGNFAPEKFDHYGKGWSEEYPLWRGSAKNKIKTMAEYRFNLCYENMSDTLGYITEKIFDSFIAGSIPIYLGAPNICDIVPANCFVDRRKFASNDILISYIENITADKWNEMRSCGRDFLKSSQYQKFNSSSVFDMIATGLKINTTKNILLY
jgi:hypothetical protein